MTTRTKKRLVLYSIPGGLLLIVVGLTLWAYVRGSWASDHPSDPPSVEAEPVCEVLESPRGTKYVQASIRLPHSREEVWEVITDYDHFGDICPYIQRPSLDYDPNRTTHLEGTVRTSIGGQLPLAVTMNAEQNLHSATCAWDQASGSVLVNRGRWEVEAVHADESILRVSLEVEVEHIPTFFLRNVSLNRLRRVVLAVAERLRSGSEGEPW